jgi:hypothetical protein
MPILPVMETPEFVNREPADPERPPRRPRQPAPRPVPQPGGGLLAAGARMSWVAGLILALSSFMDWYAGSSTEGPPLAVTGWHTGTLGKLVFFIGLAVVAHALLGDFGVELPATVPDSLVVVALGSLGTIFVLIRLISIPDTFGLTPGRGIGIWIALFSALAVIVGGLLRAGEEI